MADSQRIRGSIFPPLLSTKPILACNDHNALMPYDLGEEVIPPPLSAEPTRTVLMGKGILPPLLPPEPTITSDNNVLMPYCLGDGRSYTSEIFESKLIDYPPLRKYVVPSLSTIACNNNALMPHGSSEGRSETSERLDREFIDYSQIRGSMVHLPAAKTIVKRNNNVTYKDKYFVTACWMIFVGFFLMIAFLAWLGSSTWNHYHKKGARICLVLGFLITACIVTWMFAFTIGQLRKYQKQLDQLQSQNVRPSSMRCHTNRLP